MTDLLDARIRRRITLAWLALFWEAFWPRLTVTLLIIAVFLSVSWFGVWLVLPFWLRMGILALFALGLAVSFVWSLRTPLPDRATAIRRLERSNRLAHRPLSSLKDTLALGTRDPDTQTAWVYHRKRLLDTLPNPMKLVCPRPSEMTRDPYLARVTVLLLLYVSVGVGSGELWLRLGDAFRADVRQTAEQSIRIDAWITPPDYTGEAPVFLSEGIRSLENGAATPITIPDNSRLTLRISGGDQIAVTSVTGKGDPTPLEGDSPDQTAGEGFQTFELTLTDPQTISVHARNDLKSQWAFNLLPDNPPEIIWLKQPEETPGRGLLLAYMIEEDYPGSSGRVLITPLTDQERGSAPKGDSLYDAPEGRLYIPALRDDKADGETRLNFVDHPWAGSRVSMQLEITDAVGQTAVSEPLEITLPARPFNKPIPRALVEQRRDLARDKHHRQKTTLALDALTIAPDLFTPSTKLYLGLDFLNRSLLAARDDDALKDVADAMWTMALTLENGALGDAERDLNAAREALEKALEEGASDEEIAKLTEELREAMERYVSELAQRMQDQNAVNPPSQSQQALTNESLNQILEEIQKLAQSGDRDQAQQLLSQLQDLLSSLDRMAQPGDPQTNEMLRQLEELSGIIREQQDLRDRTYQSENRLQQGENNSGELDLNALKDALQQALEALEAEQRDLKEDLSDLSRRLAEEHQQGRNQPGQQGNTRPGQEQGREPGRQQGPQQGFGDGLNGRQAQGTEGPGGTGEDGVMGSAEQAMRNAERALGRGRTDEALTEQERALSALRQQAQQLTDQLAEAAQQRGGGLQPDQGARDPLGRAQQDGDGVNPGFNVKVPNEIDVQRARRILRELRKRFSDPDRPGLELDYLERLLRPN